MSTTIAELVTVTGLKTPGPAPCPGPHIQPVTVPCYPGRTHGLLRCICHAMIGPRSLITQNSMITATPPGRSPSTPSLVVAHANSRSQCNYRHCISASRSQPRSRSQMIFKFIISHWSSDTWDTKKPSPSPSLSGWSTNLWPTTRKAYGMRPAPSRGADGYRTVDNSRLTQDLHFIVNGETIMLAGKTSHIIKVKMSQWYRDPEPNEQGM